MIWKREFQRRGAPHWHGFLVPPQGRAGELRAEGEHYRPACGDGLYFRQWLSAVWADIVDHPDPVERMRHERAGTGIDFAEGMRCADPKRLAVYFSKHGQFGAKEYQNQPPDEWLATGKGVGRFWGYKLLRPLRVTVDLFPPDYVKIARTMRRYAYAQGVTRESRVPRTKGGGVRSEYPDVIGLAGVQLLDARRVRKRKVRRRARYLKYGAGFLCVNDGPGLAVDLARMLAMQ